MVTFGEASYDDAGFLKSNEEDKLPHSLLIIICPNLLGQLANHKIVITMYIDLSKVSDRLQQYTLLDLLTYCTNKMYARRTSSFCD